MPSAITSPIAGLFGGGARPGGQQGNVFVPQGQPQADVNYGNLVTSLENQFLRGNTPAQQLYPQTANLAANIAAQPANLTAWDPVWGEQARAGAGFGSDIALAGLGPSTPQSAGGLWANLANIGAGLPQAGQTAAAATTAAIPQLQSALTNILQAGYDPQQALYNRLLQQTTDAVRAANYASGLSSSPYGANVEGNVLGNLGINWQTQQLAREAQAAGAAGQLGTDIGNLSGLGLNQAITGARAMPQVFGDMASLTGQEAQLAAGGAALPYQTYLGQLQGLQGLGTTGVTDLTQASDLGQSQYQLPENLLSSLLSYLSGGRAASGAAYGQTQGTLGGLGSLFNAANPLLFGSQGLGGALGIDPTTGLLGGLFGGGGAGGTADVLDSNLANAAALSGSLAPDVSLAAALAALA